MWRNEEGTKDLKYEGVAEVFVALGMIVLLIIPYGFFYPIFYF